LQLYTDAKGVGHIRTAGNDARLVAGKVNLKCGNSIVHVVDKVRGSMAWRWRVQAGQAPDEGRQRHFAAAAPLPDGRPRWCSVRHLVCLTATDVLLLVLFMQVLLPVNLKQYGKGK
jgi:hypothetical protein